MQKHSQYIKGHVGCSVVEPLTLSYDPIGNSPRCVVTIYYHCSGRLSNEFYKPNGIKETRFDFKALNPNVKANEK